MKVVYFDRSGFAMWVKRLEASRFPWPRQLDQEVLNISASDFELLLEGIDMWRRPPEWILGFTPTGF